MTTKIKLENLKEKYAWRAGHGDLSPTPSSQAVTKVARPTCWPSQILLASSLCPRVELRIYVVGETVTHICVSILFTSRAVFLQ